MKDTSLQYRQYFVDELCLHKNGRCMVKGKIQSSGKEEAHMQAVDLARVQARLLEMGKTVADVLERNGVPHMITFGTLLGAVRHHGFVPWDDDFDFFLFDDTYERGIEVLRTSLPEDMFVEDEHSEPKYFHGWAHVKDLGTEAQCCHYPQDGVYAHHGLCVDLYRCKRMCLGELMEYRITEARNYLSRMKRKGLIDERSFVIKIGDLTRQVECDEGANRSKTEDVLGMVLTTVRHQFMRCSDVFPLQLYRFCGHPFWGPGNADCVLRHFYGDYMELPPEEMRVPHYDWVKFKMRQ